jgi:hypothetical protein
MSENEEYSDVQIEEEVDNETKKEFTEESLIGIPEALKQVMNNRSELVEKTLNIFKNVYGNAMRPNYITDIITGESIAIKPMNILIDEPSSFEDEKFELKCKYCSKTLYDYQKKSIKKIRELEINGYHVSDNNEKIISNGWILSLPIGSGKSLVFQFLALFYRNVPTHKIIVSTDGSNIPIHEQIQWKNYPFYYENCGYIEGKPNSVITTTDTYRQRRLTVILTHLHLIDQMREYFNMDFSQELVKKTEIVYATGFSDIKGLNLDKIDILVCVATTQTIDHLRRLSYESPFMRVIIDDYTSMPCIDSFRQILASSTLFVSGTGFNRSADMIPASYYSMKFSPTDKMTIVGRPEETYKGVVRDSIATLELMGAKCEFSTYVFVNECEEYCKSFNSTPSELYPWIKETPKICSYMALMFLLNNLEQFIQVIDRVERDIEKIDKNRISCYLDWKAKMLSVDKITKTEKKVKINPRHTKTIIENTHSNKLVEELFSGNIRDNQMGSPIVSQNCHVCGFPSTIHNDYGMVASCCGAFYCSKCLKNMTTKVIINSDTNEHVVMNDYYCCCCREKNVKFYFNTSKKKNTNVYSHILVNEFFETSQIKDHMLFDYYFYQFLNFGFKPLYHEGKPLNIKNDIAQGVFPNDILSKCKNKELSLERLLPKDQLALLSIFVINKVITELKLKIQPNSLIIFFGCPMYMRARIRDYYIEIIQKDKSKKRKPIENVEMMYANSMSELIGMHRNVLAIVAWDLPEIPDEILQLIGRIYRLCSWSNDISLFISTNSVSYE